MDLTDDIAQEVLDDSVLAGKSRYGYYAGRLYEFQNDNAGGWHGYAYSRIRSSRFSAPRTAG
jgi:filamentous hemagglutinin